MKQFCKKADKLNLAIHSVNMEFHYILWILSFCQLQSVSAKFELSTSDNWLTKTHEYELPHSNSTTVATKEFSNQEYEHSQIGSTTAGDKEFSNGIYELTQTYPTTDNSQVDDRLSTTLSTPYPTASTIMDPTTTTPTPTTYSGSPCPSYCYGRTIPLRRALVSCSECLNGDLFKDYLKSHQLITDVFLVGGNFTHISGYLCALKRIKFLKLDRNEITSIPDYNLTCFTKLLKLSFAHNQIKLVGTNMLDGLQNLNYISLEHNRIKYIAREAFLQPHLRRLRIVKLQYNKLEMVDTWIFKLPAYIIGSDVSVNTSHNMIKNIANTFNFSMHDMRKHRRITVDLGFNQVQHMSGLLSLLQGVPWHDAYDLFFAKNNFYFHNNPFDCDCDMYNFVCMFKEFQPRNHTPLYNDIYFTQLRCNTPAEAQNKSIYKLPDDVFQCYVNESCPQGAECIHTPGNSTMTVVNVAGYHVNSLPLTVPHETHIQIFYPNTSVETLPEREYLENVTTLDLSNSLLPTITAGPAHQLLDIWNINFKQCRLTIFPPEMTNTSFPQLESLDIVGNPFLCDCHMPPMRRWLVKHQETLVNVDMVQCTNVPFSGKAILKVQAKFMICGYLYVFLGGSIFMLILAVLVSYIVFLCLKRHIMLRMIKFFDRNFTLGRDAQHRSLAYHITIFVAEEDQSSQKVDDICSLIENAEENFSIYRHGYDLGSHKLDIAEKLPASEGCLFFMSVHTVQCNYCIFCFRLAVDLFIRHYHSMFLIPVLLDSRQSLIDNSKIARDTRLFLQLFDSVDVSSSPLDLNSTYNEMKQIMGRQVLDFPHALTTVTTPDAILDHNLLLPEEMEEESESDSVYCRHEISICADLDDEPDDVMQLSQLPPWRAPWRR